MSDYRFAPARKRVAAYFNDGELVFYIQEPRGKTQHSPRLVDAIKAARNEFFRVYHAKPPQQVEPTVPKTKERK